jgi:hypothetical protein
MVCPVNGEPGLVEDVQTVTTFTSVPIFAAVTAPLAILSAVTDPEPSFAATTAPSFIFVTVTAPEEIFPAVTAFAAIAVSSTAPEAIFVDVTAPVAILFAVTALSDIAVVETTETHLVPSYDQVFPPEENVSPLVGLFGKSMGIRQPPNFQKN